MTPKTYEKLTPYVVTLGTAGGPSWWPGPKVGQRTGIATAVVVGRNIYLVDCGSGVGRQMARAGLPLEDLQAVFLTHLHSDHTVDLASLALFGLRVLRDRSNAPVRIIGPGNRQMVPPTSQFAEAKPSPIFADAPTPGTQEMFELLMRAHATDLNDRILDTLGTSPMDIFSAEDIRVPSNIGYHPNDCPSPSMDPFVVYEDDLVQVRAVLVEHPPIAPAFGFRFEAPGGSVTISGDTTFTENMIGLAENTDLLLHEAIDFDWVENRYGGRHGRTSPGKEHHYKAHTSVADAARVAREAGAKQLALHHLVPGTVEGAIWRKASEHFGGAFHLPDDLDVLQLRPDG